MNKLKIKPFKHLIRKKQNSLRIKTIKKKLKNLPQNPGNTVNPPLVSTDSELFWSLGTQSGYNIMIRLQKSF